MAFSTPPSLRDTSPIFCLTTKHKGGGYRVCSSPLLYETYGVLRQQYRRETEETAVSEKRGWKDFIDFLAVRVTPRHYVTPPLYG